MPPLFLRACSWPCRARKSPSAYLRRKHCAAGTATAGASTGVSSVLISAAHSPPPSTVRVNAPAVTTCCCWKLAGASMVLHGLPNLAQGPLGGAQESRSCRSSPAPAACQGPGLSAAVEGSPCRCFDTSRWCCHRRDHHRIHTACLQPCTTVGMPMHLLLHVQLEPSSTMALQAGFQTLMSLVQ